MPPAWPLVGRHEELELIEQFMSRPAPASVMLSGAAGVGKTRLAREALDLARSRGLATEWAAATSASATIPFGALAHLVPEDLIAPARSGLLRAAARALAERADGRPLMIGIDDAHHLDEASAALIHHLASTVAAFLVVTVRTGEASPDAIVAMWKDDLAERIELQPLSREEMEQLVEAALGGQVEDAAKRLLWGISQGNALFLRELVLGALDSGNLRLEAGMWRLTGTIAAAPRLIETVEARLGRLAEKERSVLELVAAGEPLEAGLLRSMAPRDVVEGLERRALLEASDDGRRTLLRLSHPIYAEVLRDRTGRLRAATLRQRLADALAGTGARRREDILRLATWRLDSDAPGDAALYGQAAYRAMALFDYRLGDRLASAAIAAGGGFDASLTHSQGLIGQGRFVEAERLLAALEASAGSETDRVKASVARAETMFWHLGQGSEALRILGEARGQVTNARSRQGIEAARGELLSASDDTEGSIHISRNQLLDPDLDPTVRIRAAMTLGWSLTVSGRMSEVANVVETAVRSLPSGPEITVHHADHWLRGNLAFARFASGEMDEGVAAMTAQYRGALEAEADSARAVLAHMVGAFEVWRGRPRTAIRWLKEGLSSFLEVDLFRHLSATLGDLAHCHALLGDVDLAEATLAEAKRHRIESFTNDQSFIARGEVWTRVARGELSSAASVAVAEADVAGSVGRKLFQAVLLHDAARIGSAAPMVAPLEELSEVVEGRLVRAYSAHARSLAEGDAAGLDAVSEEFRRMGAPLLAAEAAASSAAAYRREGRTGSALASASRAHELAERAEGARTPALSDLDVPIPLTPREREIATLAAKGLSNREIAQHLVVSVRTVDNHLHHVYSKLGIAGRGDLTQILDSRRPPPGRLTTPD